MKRTRSEINALALGIERNAWRRSLLEAGAFFLGKKADPSILIQALLLVKTAQLVRSAKNQKDALRHFHGANFQMDALIREK